MSKSLFRIIKLKGATNMKYPYEQVSVNEDLPVFTIMTSVKVISKHWHNRIEFLFLLKGQVDVFVGSKKYTLSQNDLLLINSNEVHGVESNHDNVILMVQIPILFIKKCYKSIEQVQFECYSAGKQNQQQYNEIRSLLAQLYMTLDKKKNHHDLKVHSLLLDLLYQLVSRFKVEKGIRVAKKDIERMSRLTEYIHKHYMHPITLDELAAIEQLTPPYVSRYFQKQMGQTFLRYVNGVRLEHAVHYLVETDMSIIQITLECGFANLNSFHKLFKDTFHTTPHQYRKMHAHHLSNERRKKNKKQYDFIEKNDSQYLHKYLEKDKKQYDFS